MLWTPNDSLTVKFKANFADLDFGGNLTSFYGDPLFTVHQDAPFAYRNEPTRLVLDIEYKMEGGTTFKSLTGCQELDTMNNLDLNVSTVDPTYWFLSTGEGKLRSQEFNLISNEDQRLRWVTGLFLQNRTFDIVPVDQNGFVFVGDGFPLGHPWLGSPWTKRAIRNSRRLQLLIGSPSRKMKTRSIRTWFSFLGQVCGTAH